MTDDVLTDRMAGPAIRAWEIAGALATNHDVVLATTSSVCQRHSDRFRTEAADHARFDDLERWCDVVLVQGYVLEHVPAMRRTTKVMIVDLYDPIFLEDLELNRSLPEPDRTGQIAHVVRIFEEQAKRGDFFLCASEKQRDLWLGFLAASGRVNPASYEHDPSLRSLVDVVSFGLPEDPPHRVAPALRGVVDGIAEDDDVVLWGGGVYDWLDPVTAVRAVERARTTRPNVRLFFLGVKHPNPLAVESRALTAARVTAAQLGLTGTHVFFNDGWVPYSRRADFLLDADIGISLHSDHVETAYSFRTRILDCLWAGLPIVATGGDAFADLIEQEELGIVVPAGDEEAVATALVALLEDADWRARCRTGTTRVAPRFTWSAVLDPLVRFCAEPVHAPDRRAQEPEGAPRSGRGGHPEPRPGMLPRLAGLGHRAWDVYREDGVAALARRSFGALQRRR